MSGPVIVNDMMLAYAVRYALGRRSYEVGWVCDEVGRAWPELSPYVQAVITHAITDAIDSRARQGRLLGESSDHEQWVALSAWIARQPAGVQ